MCGSRGYQVWSVTLLIKLWLIHPSAQVKVFVTGLVSLNQDIPAFKEHLRDFLVQIKVLLFNVMQI